MDEATVFWTNHHVFSELRSMVSETCDASITFDDSVQLFMHLVKRDPREEASTLMTDKSSRHELIADIRMQLRKCTHVPKKDGQTAAIVSLV